MRRTLMAAGVAVLAMAATEPGRAAEAARPAAKVWDVPTRHLVGGAQGDVGYQVFFTESAWKRAATQRRWGGGPAPVIPKVDWKRDMVITATDGTKPTAGYTIRITSVQRVGDQIVVKVRQTAPPADAIVAQVVSYPSDAVAVRRMEGPVQFIITKDAPEPPGLPNPPPPAPETPTGDTGADAGAVNLAKSVFILQQEGGIAGLNDQTIIHLYGRPLQPGEIPPGARKTADVEVAGATIRALEQTVRDSGFLGLAARYAPDRTFPDQMTRTIEVRLGGTVKSVTVLDGAENVPPAFQTVWTALQDAARPGPA